MLYDFNNVFGIHLHIAYNSHFGGLRGHSSLQNASMASEVTFDLRFEISNLNYPGIHMHVAPNSHFGGLQMPSRSHLASKLNSLISITMLPCLPGL